MHVQHSTHWWNLIWKCRQSLQPTITDFIFCIEWNEFERNENETEKSRPVSRITEQYQQSCDEYMFCFLVLIKRLHTATTLLHTTQCSNRIHKSWFRCVCVCVCRNRNWLLCNDSVIKTYIHKIIGLNEHSIYILSIRVLFVVWCV